MAVHADIVNRRCATSERTTGRCSPTSSSDDEYDQIVVAEDIGSGYRFYDSDDRVHMPEVEHLARVGRVARGRTWRSSPLTTASRRTSGTSHSACGVIEEHSPIRRHARRPRVRHCSRPVLHRRRGRSSSRSASSARLRQRTSRLRSSPKVALTFLQILLDYEETGIKIVLEESG